MAIEQTMAQIAHSQVTQSLPSLVDSIQGFQLIDNDEEKHSAVGVMVALIGDTCIYIPAIYKHGKIFSMDIMYIPEMKQWLPTQDNWITYLKSRKADLVSVLRLRDAPSGKNQPESIQLDIPFREFAKRASSEHGAQYVKRVGIPAILKEAAQAMLDEVDGNIEYHIPDAIECMKKSSAASTSRVLESILNNTALSNAFAQYYTDQDLVSVAEELGKRSEGSLTGMASNDKPAGTVKVLTGASAEARDLSDDEKKQLLLKGAVIVDSRGLTPSKVFKIRDTGSWSTANRTGLYELLKADGNTLTAYVIRIPRLKRNDAEESYVIPVDDGMARKAYKIPTPIGQVYPTATIPDKVGVRIDKAFHNTDESDMWHVRHIVVTEDGGIAFLSVTGKPSFVSNADNNLSILFDRCNCHLACVTDSCECSGDDFGEIDRIEVLPAGAKIRRNRNTLYVPNTARCIAVASHVDGDTAVRNLATLGELQEALIRQEKLLGIKIANIHHQYTVSDDTSRTTEPLGKQAAALDLVRHYALSPMDAEKLLDEVSERPVSQGRWLIKMASDTNYALTFNEENDSVEDMTTIDLNQELPQGDVQALIDASNSGVKEVLDVTLLKTLATDTSTVRQIQGLVPSLFSALDAVSRILFMLRAGDSMGIAYGENRANDMEIQFSQLVNALGDAIICLQQGRVDSVHDLLEGPLASSIG